MVSSGRSTVGADGPAADNNSSGRRQSLRLKRKAEEQEKTSRKKEKVDLDNDPEELSDLSLDSDNDDDDDDTSSSEKEYESAANVKKKGAKRASKALAAPLVFEAGKWPKVETAEGPSDPRINTVPKGTTIPAIGNTLRTGYDNYLDCVLERAAAKSGIPRRCGRTRIEIDFSHFTMCLLREVNAHIRCDRCSVYALPCGSDKTHACDSCIKVGLPCTSTDSVKKTRATFAPPVGPTPRTDAIASFSKKTAERAALIANQAWLDKRRPLSAGYGKNKRVHRTALARRTEKRCIREVLREMENEQLTGLKVAGSAEDSEGGNDDDDDNNDGGGDDDDNDPVTSKTNKGKGRAEGNDEDADQEMIDAQDEEALEEQEQADLDAAIDASRREAEAPKDNIAAGPSRSQPKRQLKPQAPATATVQSRTSRASSSLRGAYNTFLDEIARRIAKRLGRALPDKRSRIEIDYAHFIMALDRPVAVSHNLCDRCRAQGHTARVLPWPGVLKKPARIMQVLSKEYAEAAAKLASESWQRQKQPGATRWMATTGQGGESDGEAEGGGEGDGEGDGEEDDGGDNKEDGGAGGGIRHLTRSDISRELEREAVLLELEHAQQRPSPREQARQAAAAREVITLGQSNTTPNTKLTSTTEEVVRLRAEVDQLRLQIANKGGTVDEKAVSQAVQTAVYSTSAQELPGPLQIPAVQRRALSLMVQPEEDDPNIDPALALAAASGALSDSEEDGELFVPAGQQTPTIGQSNFDLSGAATVNTLGAPARPSLGYAILQRRLAEAAAPVGSLRTHHQISQDTPKAGRPFDSTPNDQLQQIHGLLTRQGIVQGEGAGDEAVIQMAIEVMRKEEKRQSDNAQRACEGRAERAGKSPSDIADDQFFRENVDKRDIDRLLRNVSGPVKDADDVRTLLVMAAAALEKKKNRNVSRRAVTERYKAKRKARIEAQNQQRVVSQAEEPITRVSSEEVQFEDMTQAQNTHQQPVGGNVQPAAARAARAAAPADVPANVFQPPPGYVQAQPWQSFEQAQAPTFAQSNEPEPQDTEMGDLDAYGYGSEFDGLRYQIANYLPAYGDPTDHQLARIDKHP
ncbi:hypothetical protein BJY04DRAFT_220364 [Aspergillus karnatakaensis]|uniref:uncharacterized protein n=1 Tax=Aspergillus karnatakaensis TaxID=1810916 RepID=UPI003CCD0EDC